MQQCESTVRRRFHEPESHHDEGYKKFQEAFMKGENHLLPAEVSFGACKVMKCIGLLDINGKSGVYGTGFRISRKLIMTCQHVLEKMGEHDVIQFNQFEPQPAGHPGSGLSPDPVTFRLRPDLFYYESQRNLDFAVIGIEEADGNAGSASVGIISCVNPVSEDTLRAKHRVSIFSHAEGKRLRLSLLGNVPEQKPATGPPLPEEIFLHEAETEYGSSGAPVFDETWQLVGIHQGAEIGPGQREVFYANSGTLIKFIIREMYSESDKPLTMFETNLQGREEELGVPFVNFSKKLEDKSGWQDQDPQTLIPENREEPTPGRKVKYYISMVIILLVVLAGAILIFQRYFPGSSLRYWYCRRGSMKDNELHFLYTTMDFQMARVRGVEFKFRDLKEKFNLGFDEMQNSRDMHYYLNVDRCAHGGVRHVASFLDGLPMVRGAEVVAVDHGCTEVYFYSSGWNTYKSARRIKCSSHP